MMRPSTLFLSIEILKGLHKKLGYRL